MQIALRQKLETCKTLPSLPAVAVHLLRLCQRENFDIADVARAIGSDANLSAKVVALVNSPLFAMRQEVRTVSHALVLLGVNAVRTIALSFALVADMRAHERNGFNHRRYWQRAVFAAAAAQELARAAGLRHPEERSPEISASPIFPAPRTAIRRSSIMRRRSGWPPIL